MESLSFFNISSASSLELGLLISLSLSEITLSAPRTKRFGFLLLTLIDLISARFFEIDKGFAPSAKSEVFISSSSTFDTITSLSILYLSKIFFLTPLCDAKIILIYFFLYR